MQPWLLHDGSQPLDPIHQDSPAASSAVRFQHFCYRQHLPSTRFVFRPDSHQHHRRSACLLVGPTSHSRTPSTTSDTRPYFNLFTFDFVALHGSSHLLFSCTEQINAYLLYLVVAMGPVKEYLTSYQTT